LTNGLVSGVLIGQGDSYGNLAVLSGGSGVDLKVERGGVAVYAGGYELNAVFEGQSEFLDAGDSVAGVASGSIIDAYSDEDIGSGGVAIAAVVNNGGAELIESGGLSTKVKIHSGGVETVSAGGLASATTVSLGGQLNVSSGGVATGSIIDKGGVLIVAGTASATSLASGGSEQVLSGGANSGGKVVKGAALTISSGGSAWGGVVGGVMVVSSGGEIDGELTISGGVVSLYGAMSSGQTLTFAGPSGELILQAGADFAAEISGFNAPAKKIDLAGFGFTTSETVSWTQSASGSGTLTITDGGQVAQLSLAGTYATSNFVLTNDHSGGTFVADPPASGLAVFAQAAAGFTSRRGANASPAPFAGEGHDQTAGAVHLGARPG
jgi:autotransporter passenger strand-loop-strand repeat protein